MATVPGQPMQDATGGIPPELQPTQSDLLMAAAIMHGQGKFQVAGGFDDDFGVGKKSVLQIDPMAQPMQQRGAAPTERPLAERILDAQAKARDESGAAWLSDIRKLLPDIPRAEFDKAVKQVGIGGPAALWPSTDRKLVTPERAQGALSIGGNPREILWSKEPRK